MPPRSPWMKRRILGFQRRVWCPKCTPDSSSSLMPTSAMESPLEMDLERRRAVSGGGRTRRRAPGRAAVPELPSWDRPGRWSEIAGTSLRKFAQAPSFQAVRAGPPFPYLRWSGPCNTASGAARMGRPTALKDAGEVFGERRADVDALARDGVVEREPLGVQELALEAERAGVAVLGIARHRVADRLQVGADLVRAAGLEPHAQQRVAVEHTLGLEVGDRGAAVGGVGRHAGADASIAAERRLDRAGARVRPALDER